MLSEARSKAPPDSRQIGTLCFTGATGQRVSVWQLQRNQVRAAKAKLPHTVPSWLDGQRSCNPGCANVPAIGRSVEGEIDCKVVWGYEGWW